HYEFSQLHSSLLDRRDGREQWPFASLPGVTDNTQRAGRDVLSGITAATPAVPQPPPKAADGPTQAHDRETSLLFVAVAGLRCQHFVQRAVAAMILHLFLV